MVATSPPPAVAAAPKPTLTGADLAAGKAKLGAPAAAAPKLPGAGAALGLKSPKAAGVTRSASPVMNAARPAPAAKPGIFGKLFGKGEPKPDKATQTLFEDPEPKVLHPSDKKPKK